MLNTAGDKLLVGLQLRTPPNTFIVCLLRGCALIFTLQRLHRGCDESDAVHNHSRADHAVAKLERLLC